MDNQIQPHITVVSPALGVLGFGVVTQIDAKEQSRIWMISTDDAGVKQMRSVKALGHPQ